MKSLKAKLKNWVLDYLIKPIKLEQIITINDVGQIKIDGRIIEASELKALQEEVKAFQTFRLKTLLLNTPKSLAENRMFKDSKSWDDMLAGKLTLYTVDVQETIMVKILNAPIGNQVVVQQNPYRK